MKHITALFLSRSSAGRHLGPPKGLGLVLLMALLMAGSSTSSGLASASNDASGSTTEAPAGSSSGTAPVASTASPREELVILLRGSADSPVAEALAGQHLAGIRGVAEALDVPIRVVDVDDAGAPAEVRLTPILVHQSPRGRSFFQGRYTDLGKVTHFVRTSRAIPPTENRQTKTDILMLELGRSRVIAPIKITSLGGELPLDLQPRAFQAMAQGAVESGLERFRPRERVELGPSDRAFYFDFYPYLAEDGTLFVSTALFSQFNCIEPVFQTFETPQSGPWAERADVFAAAARQLEKAVLEQLRSSAIGDGFDPIPSHVDLASWAELGLELPAAGNQLDPSLAAAVELGGRWRVAPASADSGPRLVFRFPSPLERYSGEVAKLEGELVLSEGLGLVGATGHLSASTGSVTMGEDTLDAAIHGKMIRVERFPESTFTLESVRPGAEPIAFGTLSRFVARGLFTLMGQSVPVTVRGQVEPTIGADGQPRLRALAAFDIRLSDPFGIEGPDGPAPARDTLEFFLDFEMEPTD